MDDYTRAAAETALRHMFRPNGHFSICTVDQLLAVAKVVPPRHEYDAMRLLHCVDWRSMTAELRDETVRRLLGWFDLPAFDPFTESRSLPKTTRGNVLTRWLS